MAVFPPPRPKEREATSAHTEGLTQGEGLTRSGLLTLGTHTAVQRGGKLPREPPLHHFPCLRAYHLFHHEKTTTPLSTSCFICGDYHHYLIREPFPSISVGPAGGTLGKGSAGVNGAGLTSGSGTEDSAGSTGGERPLGMDQGRCWNHRLSSQGCQGESGKH